MALPNHTNHTISKFDQQLNQLILQQTAQLKTEFAANAQLVTAAINERVLTTPTPQSEMVTQAPHHINSPEEMSILLAKISELTSSPGKTITHEDELYLEQQISDLLGLELTTQLGEIKLHSSMGKIKSMPHLKTTPSFTYHQITDVPEANLSKYRSYFGWIGNNNQINRFGVSISPTALGMVFSPQLTKQLKLRKVLVINPTDAKFIVAQIVDLFENPNPTYLFGGSPQLIRQGMFWSPENVGKTMFFFLSDDAQSTQTGLVNLPS